MTTNKRENFAKIVEKKVTSSLAQEKFHRGVLNSPENFRRHKLISRPDSTFDLGVGRSYSRGTMEGGHLGGGSDPCPSPKSVW